MRGLQRVGLAVAVAMVCVLASAGVCAQALRGLRLRVDPSVLSYTSESLQAKDVALPMGRLVDGPKTTATTVGFGLMPAGLAMGIGGAVNNHVNLGINTQLSIVSSSSKVEGGATTDSDLTRIALMPYVEYVFGETDAARGFIGLHGGLTSVAAAVDMGGSATGSALAVGVDAGLHYFLNEHVSLDPQVSLRYTAGSVEDVSITATTFLVSIGLSAWIGSSTADDDQSATGATTSDGDVWARPRAQRRPRQAASDSRGIAVMSVTVVNGVRVDLMGDAGHPDVIAMRFQRMTPAHRAPTLRCETWAIVNGDSRTEVSGAVYKGEPAGPGVQESLKSHVPTTALRALAPNGTAYGQSAAAFDVCGLRLDLNISNRADLITFFRRFDKMLQLNGAPSEPTPAETPTTQEAPTPATAAPTETPAATPTETPAATPTAEPPATTTP